MMLIVGMYAACCRPADHLPGALQRVLLGGPHLHRHLAGPRAVGATLLRTDLMLASHVLIPSVFLSSPARCTLAVHQLASPRRPPLPAMRAPVPLWGLPLCAWFHDPPTHPLPHCHTHLVHTHPPTTTTAPHPPQLLLLVQLRPGVHQAPRRRAAVSAGVQAAGPWARSLGCWRGLGSRGLDGASRPWFSRAHHLVGCLAEC